MATINKVIEHVDRVKPNAYGEEDKFRWMRDLDGMVKRLVFQDGDSVAYEYPDDMDTELLVGVPFEDVYSLYMEAMIDYHNREYDHYNNALAMFSTRFDEYKKAYIREHMPASPGTVRL